MRALLDLLPLPPIDGPFRVTTREGERASCLVWWRRQREIYISFSAFSGSEVGAAALQRIPIAEEASALQCTFQTLAALVERRREERGEIKSVQYAARRERGRRGNQAKVSYPSEVAPCMHA